MQRCPAAVARLFKGRRPGGGAWSYSKKRVCLSGKVVGSAPEPGTFREKGYAPVLGHQRGATKWLRGERCPACNILEGIRKRGKAEKESRIGGVRLQSFKNRTRRCRRAMYCCEKVPSAGGGGESFLSCSSAHTNCNGGPNLCALHELRLSGGSQKKTCDRGKVL